MGLPASRLASEPAQDGPMRGWVVRRIPWLPIACALVVMLVGCTRRYYRNFADSDVYRIERERQFDWRWKLPDRPVDAHPLSRIGDVNDPNHVPIPPDDPGARPFQVTAGRPLEFVGWSHRGTTPVEDMRWLKVIPREPDGSTRLDAASAMRIALKNNRDYQTQYENVYLQALLLTQTRFQFFPQLFPNQTTQFRHFGSGSNDSNQLQLLTNDTLNWTFFSGANLAVNFANSLIFEFNGKGFETVLSGFNFTFTQPLLQGAFARNVTQPLSVFERQTLYAVRTFAEFRRSFYVTTVSGYLNLLNQLQQIRNQENLVQSAKRNLDEYDALVRAGFINPLQRDTIAQTYQQARLGLLNQQATFQTSLDLYRINQLGLPADFPLKIDETLLKRFELNDPRLDSLRKDNDALYLALLQFDRAPDPDLMAETARKLLAQFRQLREVADSVEAELGRWQARIKAEAGKVGAGPGPIEQDERESFQRQVALAKELAAGFELSRTAIDDDIDLIDDFLGSLGKAPPDESFAKLRQELVGRDFRARLSELFVIQTQVRVYLIELNPVEMTVPQAISVALANRLDLMNSLGQVTDAWRNTEAAGNSLLAGLNLVYNGSIDTAPNHLGILRFDSHTDLQQVGIQFSPPVVRRVQRNTYRSDQIAYQRARRAYMLQHDVIVQSIRFDMRELNLNRRQFEIGRESLLIAARQVDQAEYNARVSTDANSGAGQSAGQNLANALSQLLGAKNGLINNWIQYEIQRIDLYRDFDIMNIDANGVWTNDTATPTAPGGGPVASEPDPVGAPVERLLPGPAASPDPVGAGTDTVLPPPPTAPSPFAPR